ncbi:hypothetical protein D3C86_1960070 [compost metagenome]
MLAVRPCAAGTVEAVRLVLLEQGLVLAAGNLLLDQVDSDLLQGAPAGGRVRVGGNMPLLWGRDTHRGRLAIKCSERGPVIRDVGASAAINAD